jgi:hypothetical protein
MVGWLIPTIVTTHSIGSLHSLTVEVYGHYDKWQISLHKTIGNCQRESLYELNIILSLLVSLQPFYDMYFFAAKY